MPVARAQRVVQPGQFLGTQGDPWDAQWDMLCCLVGAIASIGAFAGLTDVHERQLRRMGRAGAPA